MKRLSHVTSILLFSLLLTLMSSCENIAKFTEVATGEEANPRTTISFYGINTIDNVTDTSATINWTHVSGAVQYQVFSVNNGVLSLMGSIMAPTATYALTGLTPSSTTTYGVRMVDSELQTDSNTNYVTITTTGAPEAPSALTLTSPASSPNFDETPIITISGVKSSDTVKLFTDNTCSTQTGSSAVASSTTIAITTSALAGGTYNFYANSTGAGGTSSCSSATVSYVKNSCPTGYILVPANAAVGAPDNFCVMKYEAKKDVNDNPESIEAGSPWVSITQTLAKTECTSLGANYDLISNPEWMAIARNIENVDSNWSGSTVGTGFLSRGWVTGNSAVAPSTGTGCLYNSAANTCAPTGDHEDKRTLTLSNGEVIWDLSGNVYEWVDWTLGGTLSTNMSQADMASNSSSTASGWKEYTDLDIFTGHSPVTAILPSDPTFNATHGMGRYYYRADASGGAALRGGDWNNGTYAGAFALDLIISSAVSSAGFGFRCVFRVP